MVPEAAASYILFLLRFINYLFKPSDEAKSNELDGFFLLEASGAEFPEDVKQLNVSDRRLTSIVEVSPCYHCFIVDISMFISHSLHCTHCI